MKSYTMTEFMKEIAKQSKKHKWMQSPDASFLFLDTGDGFKTLNTADVYAATEVNPDGSVTLISMKELFKAKQIYSQPEVQEVVIPQEEQPQEGEQNV